MKWKWFSRQKHLTESLGLDISRHSIQLIFLTRKNTHCHIQQLLHIPIEKHKFHSLEEATINAIKQGIAQLKTHHRKVNIAVPDVAALSRTFPLDTSHSEWKKAALLKMAPDIPVSLDKVYLDFEVTKIITPTPREVVLGVAYPQSNLQQRLHILQSAGLEPEVVELESHAIERALRYLKMMQAHSKQSACIYLTKETLTLLLWFQKSVIALSSDYLINSNQSIAIFQQIQQQLAQLLFTSTTKTVQNVYLTGTHPLRLVIAGICRRQLGLHLYSIKPKMHCDNAALHTIDQSLVAFGLALRGNGYSF